MKKLLTILFATMLFLAACNSAKETNETTDGAASDDVVKIKVASLIPPMTDMLEAVKPALKEDGVDMEIVILGDNVQPNQALKDKEVDANFFQHPPYMEQFNEAHDANLVVVQPVYHAMLGAYSNKYNSVDELPEGAEVAAPNDSSNLARALLLLEKGGLITLEEGVGLTATQKDIVDNPKNLKITEVDLLMLARTIDDVDLVTMLPAYAEPLGLTPKNNSLIDEGESDFPIVVVAREDNANDEAIQKLAKHMAGPEIAKFIEENFSDTYMTASE
ncbi:MetQ/NlpA family ABC transporter substrate-binding protein [Sporosarcina ureilytica]|uniref:Lipoprotein n=1 Tax=Sporosarcina ureilytica TaxID=298596 RepID=A0A1D8JG29_9BACL|nr:MetQ/NlpA family ABC transporter substrate-binding protein [Sporosarcina ureilytica]AOV07661.1 ABC transporter substrate-binding protein [Sporosarcina ureilytica]